MPTIRRATPADAGVIAWHRARMFQDMGMVPESLFEAFRSRSRERIHAGLVSGAYIGWLVPHPTDAGTIVTGAGVILRPIPPIPIPGPSGKMKMYDGTQALIVNVFTEPQWRRHGFARVLMERIIAWCREERIESIVLHASDDGSALYEQLGFITTNEMRLKNVTS